MTETVSIDHTAAERRIAGTVSVGVAVGLAVDPRYPSAG